MTIHDQLRDLLIKHTSEETVPLDHPDQPEHGDYASPVAMTLAKKQGRAPMDIAEELKQKLINERWDILVAPPGFLNFRLTSTARAAYMSEILKEGDRFGSNDTLKGKKVMVEYTDPNPFKEFHIGHLMSNAIGEAISRIVEFSGAEVKRANYQGDVGLHVAKAIFSISDFPGALPADDASLEEKIQLWGSAYAAGSDTFDSGEKWKKEMRDLNKKIYERSDPKINILYDAGLKTSLEYFDFIYKRLGTHFDEYFFESKTGPRGKAIVEDALKKNIFEQSDGAIVYRGEKSGLHTRVFINSERLPTYEAKELGLAFIKQERWSHDISFVVTGNEIIDYFRVVKTALSEIDAALAQKIVHVPHGFLRLQSGKMSSRTGEVIRAEDVLDEAKEKLHEKTSDESVEEVAAVGAVKYSILRQSVGKDIIFDFNTSLSFEGDSGPYLQYTHARARSVLEKAGRKGVATSRSKIISGESIAVERVLLWFPDAVLESLETRDPHYIANYLFNLAQVFNSFYAKERILGADDEDYKLALTAAVAITLKNGLWLLGISAPDRM